MAGNFHQTIVIGTVGTKQDLRYTADGTAVQGFSIAVNEYWNDRQTNEKREKTTWYSASGWGKTAESLAKYVQVGMNIMITGTVSARAYTSNDGSPRASLDIRIDNFQLLGSRGDNNSQQDNEQYEGAGQDTEDIPFSHEGWMY